MPTLGEFEIRRIVDGQPLASRRGQSFAPRPDRGLLIDGNRQFGDQIELRRHIVRTDPTSLLRLKQDVPDFEAP